VSEEPEKKKRPRGLIAAAVFLAVVVLGGGGLLVWNAATASETPSPSPSESHESTADSVREVDSTGDECPEVTAPERDVSKPLEKVHYEDLPNGRSIVVSDEYGPAIRDADGVYRCYDQSVTGALLATANYVKQVSNQSALAYDARFMSDTPERKVLEMEGPQSSGGDGNIIGYNVPSHLAGTETAPALPVTLLIGDPQGNRISLSFSIRWEAGDWHVLTMPDTAERFVVERNPQLSNYVLWEPAP